MNRVLEEQERAPRKGCYFPELSMGRGGGGPLPHPPGANTSSHPLSTLLRRFEAHRLEPTKCLSMLGFHAAMTVDVSVQWEKDENKQPEQKLER